MVTGEEEEGKIEERKETGNKETGREERIERLPLKKE